MKLSAFSILLSCLLYFTSCTKESQVAEQNTFVKAIATDVGVVAVGTTPLEDGNFLMVSQDFNQESPGYAVKMDENGNVIWKKRLSDLNHTIWKVLVLPGAGFAIVGYSSAEATGLTICMYDLDGNLTSTKELDVPTEARYNSPAVIFRLQNGNYVFASSQQFVQPGNDNYIMVTDPSFNLIRRYSIPFIPKFYGYYFRGGCEMPDKTIAFTASSLYIGKNVADSGELNTLLLRTDLNGKKISDKILFDKGYSNTPNCLLPYKSGLLSITGRMVGFNSGDGIVVRYVNNSDAGELISGRITLTTLDSAGGILHRKVLEDYPNNGMISSAKPTGDGGFILCGIVNQSDYPSIFSLTKIYLTKLDANLNQQWTKIIETPSASYAMDIFQTKDGGYFVGGFQKSLNQRFTMMAIKTDASGNIK